MKTPTTVKFMSIAEFKIINNIANSEKAQVIKNPNTGKLFLTIGSHTFKCQSNIDPQKEMKMIVDNDAFKDACLVNVKASSENILFTL